jgi:hypothetical protein
MLLTLSNGEHFAMGAAIYDYNSLPGSDTSARLILQVWVEGQKTSAILDTGAPYLVCSPNLARLVEFDPAASLSQYELLIRGYWIKGNLHRANLTLPASEGESLSLDVTAFVPDPDELFNFPSFLGWSSCLEWIRFAVDPSSSTFYFGPHP